MKKIGHIAGSRIWQLGDWEPSLERTVYEKDDFLGDVLKDEWAADIGAGTLVIAAALSGTVVHTTTALNDDHATLASALNFMASHACGIEARLALNNVTDCTIELGFNDALLEAQGRAFNDYDLTPGNLPSPISADAVIIGFDDPDSLVYTNFTAVNVINTAAPAATDLGIIPVNDRFYVLRVQLDAAGNAYYYVDGALLATHALAITPGDALTPWITISNKAAGIRILTVDYVKVWQNR